MLYKKNHQMIKLSKLVTTSSIFFFFFSHLIKIVLLQIKFEGTTLSNFYWDRKINWPVVKSIKEPNIPKSVKNRTFPTIWSIKSNTEKGNLKLSIIKVETFKKRTFWDVFIPNEYIPHFLLACLLSLSR